MKRYASILTMCLLVIFTASSQNATKINALLKVEIFLVENKTDSIPYYLAVLQKSPYQQLLSRVYNNSAVSYKDYLEFVTHTSKHPKIKYEFISDYINENIKTPTSTSEINSDYVEIKWFQISKLRDEVGIEEASQVQNKLEKYIDKFNIESNEVLRAKTLVSTHQLVLFQISNEIEKGIALCFKGIEIAENLHDTKLKSILLYHLTDFLLIEGKLDEYIKVSEESLQLENTLDKKSFYYNLIIQHLLDAYIYKGGYNNRIIELLNEIFDNENMRPYSYSLFAKYLSTLGEDSFEFQTILRKFKVPNLLSFCKKIETLGKDVLNPNEYYYILFENANVLKSKGYYDESYLYMKKMYCLNKKDIF